MQKSILLFSLVVSTMMLTSTNSRAQESKSETVQVKLSNPGQKGVLELHIRSGNITVIGQDRRDVEIGFSAEEKKKNIEHGDLKLISATAVNMDIREHNNSINIEADNNRTDFKILVPRNFDLSLRSHHNADILVERVSGELEVQSHHGSIHLREIEGSVSAETHHGGIIATFSSVNDSRPMAFSTYHGDVEISLPTGINCRAKIKPGKGDIYTDFDIDVLPSQRETNIDDNGAKEIKIGGWVVGDIGSGGKEFMFATYHGDVIIRKS